MGRYIGPKCKLCRREGIQICQKTKCATAKRKFPPGLHGVKGYRRLSNYGQQLREKQKTKRIFNVTEKQFRKYYNDAARSKDATGDALLRGLEIRLDNVVFRLDFAVSRGQARQMVSHGFITVNGKKLDIPGYQVRVGDVIAIKENKKKSKLVKEAFERKKDSELAWLFFDKEQNEAKVLNLPNRTDTKEDINSTLIVEFYSR